MQATQQEPTWLDRMIERAPSVALFMALVIGAAALWAGAREHDLASMLEQLMVASVLSYLASSAVAETPYATPESPFRDRMLVFLSRANLPVVAASWVFAAHDHSGARLMALVGFLFFIAHVVGRYLRADGPRE